MDNNPIKERLAKLRQEHEERIAKAQNIGKPKSKPIKKKTPIK